MPWFTESECSFLRNKAFSWKILKTQNFPTHNQTRYGGSFFFTTNYVRIQMTRCPLQFLLFLKSNIVLWNKSLWTFLPKVINNHDRFCWFLFLFVIHYIYSVFSVDLKDLYTHLNKLFFVSFFSSHFLLRHSPNIQKLSTEFCFVCN